MRSILCSRRLILCAHGFQGDDSTEKFAFTVLYWGTPDRALYHSRTFYQEENNPFTSQNSLDLGEQNLWKSGDV